MALRFWVGGTGTWDASDTTHWSTSTGGGSGASVPGSGDSATFDGSSGGGTVTVGAAYNPNIVSIGMGAFTGTLDFSVNNNSPTLGTFSSTGTGTRTLNMGSGTWTITGVNTIWDVTTATNFTLNAGSSLISVTNATSTAKTIVSGTGVALTYNDLTFSGSGTGTYAVQGSSAVTTWRDIKVSNTGGASFTITSNTTKFRNITFDSGYSGTWSSNGIIQITGDVTLLSTMLVTATGTWTFNRTSGTSIITSAGLSMPHAITVNTPGAGVQLFDALLITGILTLTAGTFDANGKNVTALTFVGTGSTTRVLTMGAGTWTVTGNNTTVVSLGNVTALTINTPATFNLTYSGATGTRTITFGTTGGTEANSLSYNISAGTDTVNLSASGFYKNVDFTGFSGSFGSTSPSVSIAGNLTLSSTMTVVSGGPTLIFISTASGKTINTNGVQINRSFTFNGVGGDWTLQGALDTSGAALAVITLTNGTFITNNFAVNSASFALGSGTKTLTPGSTIWTLTDSGTLWDTNTNSTGFTLTANTATAKLTNATSSSKTISGVSVLANLWITGVGTGVFILGTTTATTSYSDIKIDNAPHTVQIFAGKTIDLGSTGTFTVNGTNGFMNSFISTTKGTAWSLTKSSGTISGDYLILQDSAASGGAIFNANHSIDMGGNTGWNFSNNLALIQGVTTIQGITSITL